MATAMAKKVQIPTPEEIRAIRGKRTQAEVAELVGVGQGVWASWEKGTRQPSRQSAILIDLLKKKKLK